MCWASLSVTITLFPLPVHVHLPRTPGIGGPAVPLSTINPVAFAISAGVSKVHAVLPGSGDAEARFAVENTKPNRKEAALMDAITLKDRA